MSTCRDCGGSGVVEEDGAGALGYVVKRACTSCARRATGELEAELAIAHKANMHVDGKVAAVKLAKAEARVTELETSITNFFAATKEAWGAWKYPTYLREAYEALRLESKLIGAPGPSVSVPETSGTAESNTAISHSTPARAPEEAGTSKWVGVTDPSGRSCVLNTEEWAKAFDEAQRASEAFTIDSRVTAPDGDEQGTVVREPIVGIHWDGDSPGTVTEEKTNGPRAVRPVEARTKEASPRPICTECNDTHQMPAPEDSGSNFWMCTRCPTPCQKCRHGGNGPFCEETPCACDCHAKSFQYAGRRTNEASHASIGSGAGDDEGYIHPDVLASQSKEFQAEYELRGTRFAKSSGKKLGEGSTDDGPRLCDACGRDLDRESKAASDNAATARTDSAFPPRTVSWEAFEEATANLARVVNERDALRAQLEQRTEPALVEMLRDKAKERRRAAASDDLRGSSADRVEHVAQGLEEAADLVAGWLRGDRA